ncbi:T9SS type A sorting domain-containing protein [Ichthyenterobacterium magnum]|uniref:Putative secreted protein (Por secretion system target) n=1 Tax=Ichthyenterobacterium magnum TaxID=1230530 RepID=A0A420DGI4_9FLAO|nr:T9SS type A sorting domain-containing protein [Ichthyenterobacterium magnum]RKE92190.1 putative secreted protein (Por secretion system target) [Ichthyenterobacterium magnum]
MVIKNTRVKITKLSLVILAFFSLNTQAQDVSCGTKESAESIEFFNDNKERILQIEQTFLNNEFRSANAVTSVPIKAHVLRTSAGTGGLSVSDLNNAMDVMNAFYAGANLEFYLCDGINYIDDDTYYDYLDDQEAALTANNVPNLINIYFANSVTRVDTVDGNYAICGYAYYPGGADTILMDNSCALNGSTLAHEMGHFFSLRHTHGGTANELVDGSNCTTEGDYICDTPADPRLSYSNVNSSCVYTGTDTDANGDSYVPDTSNVMSYSRKSCRNSFTPQQLARIYATQQLARNYFDCASIDADFVADNTSSCSNSLTVNFTDNSTGATSWQWDVDGDDIIDYTSQNPSHTYATSGIYDVTLTISNAQNTISKSNLEYIKVGAQKSVPLVEGFEGFLQASTDGWTATNEAGSSFIWYATSGPTTSTDTGPFNDNTTGNTSGVFLYTEASGSNPGDVAEFISPCININYTDAMFEFAYHMYGSTMGELHVDIDSGSGYTNDVTQAIVGSQQSNQSDAYLTRQIDLSGYAGQTINIRFRAIRGSNFNSDIAIDDINLTGTTTLSTETFTADSIRIYPNPVNNTIINVKLKESNESLTYRIVNLLGQNILNGNLKNNQIDVSNIASGSYLLILDSNGQKVIKKFVKL